MKTCPACRAENPDQARLCHQCGKRFDDSGTPPDLDAAATLVPEDRPLLASRYRLIRELGRGAMGIVHLASDTRLDIDVAVKILPPDVGQDPRAVARLKNEALSAMKLSHQNIMRLVNYEEADGERFLVMEYLDGTNLLHLLSRAPEGRLPLRQFADFARQICAGVAFAHGERVIHHDLKPANIMTTSSGRVKVTDFGIAHVVRETVTRATSTEAAGTLVYMAPEILQGRRGDAAGDQYALGATFYELLTGEPPFTTGDITYQHLNLPPEPLSGVPEHVSAAILRALAKRPEDRWPDVATFARALADDSGVEWNERGTVFVDTEPKETWADGGTTVRPVSQTGAGKLFVTSDPPEAVVFVDDMEVGKAGTLISAVPAGERRLRLSLPGYEDAVQPVTVEPDRITRIDSVTLDPELPSVNIITDPLNAQIFFDGEEVGRTPQTLRRVPAGEHTVRLLLPGHAEVEETVEVTPPVTDLEYRLEGGAVEFRGKWVTKEHRDGVLEREAEEKRRREEEEQRRREEAERKAEEERQRKAEEDRVRAEEDRVRKEEADRKAEEELQRRARVNAEYLAEQEVLAPLVKTLTDIWNASLYAACLIPILGLFVGLLVLELFPHGPSFPVASGVTFGGLLLLLFYALWASWARFRTVRGAVRRGLFYQATALALERRKKKPAEAELLLTEIADAKKTRIDSVKWRLELALSSRSWKKAEKLVAELRRMDMPAATEFEDRVADVIAAELESAISSRSWKKAEKLVVELRRMDMPAATEFEDRVARAREEDARRRRELARKRRPWIIAVTACTAVLLGWLMYPWILTWQIEAAISANSFDRATELTARLRNRDAAAAAPFPQRIRSARQQCVAALPGELREAWRAGNTAQRDEALQRLRALDPNNSAIARYSGPVAGELIRTLSGHTDRVGSVAVAGDRIVSGSGDRTIKVWDLNSGQLIRTLSGHTSTVWSVAVAGDRIVSGSGNWNDPSGDNTIRVWDINSGQLIRTLSGHTNSVYSVAVAGDRIVSGSYDNTIKVWDINSGRLIRTLSGHTSGVLSVAVAGDRIVSGSNGRTIRIWRAPWE